ncbi:hypothetical protein [Curtobacterium sp. BRD11]|uniref:hypothetical protein n=1 Tax=Curtobacterium sp. BRD11 TaxID=2962581 RepID=UPI00288236B3|nr:hypothetical protein [Curtobacterium sp. BRD11]MDT0211214.1 hypothetical protein [Curtobacterium sp. BRD11]
MCATHDRRVRKTGDPHDRGYLGGRPLIGEHPTWAAIHKRLYRSRGPAKKYTCVDCGRRAQEWSYDGKDDNQLIGRAHGFDLAYSLNLDHYEPRCISCHRIFDNRLRKVMPVIIYRPKQPASMQLLIEVIP